jgi:hypothetical protein
MKLTSDFQWAEHSAVLRLRKSDPYNFALVNSSE